MLQAISTGDLEKFRSLLPTINVNEPIPRTDEDPSVECNSTPLHLACSMGKVDIVKELLALEIVDVNLPDSHNLTPIILAINNKNFEIVELLSSCERTYLNVYDGYHNPVLMTAIAAGDLPIVNLLVRNPKVDVNLPRRDKDSMTPLLFAVTYSLKETVRSLLTRTDIQINHQNRHGNTALHVACSTDDIEMVELFLSQPTIAFELPNWQGNTPLLNAAGHGNSSIVALIVQRRDFHSLNRLNNEQVSAIACASYRGHLEVVRILLDQETIDLNLTQENIKKSSLLLAIQGQNSEIVRLLLRWPGWDISKFNGPTTSPLVLACEMGFEDILNVFFQEKDSIDKWLHAYNDLTLLLVHVISKGLSDLLPYFMNYPGYEFEKHVTAENVFQAISVAFQQGFIQVIRMIYEFIDINRIKQDGYTLLHAAVSAGRVDTVEILLGDPKLTSGTLNSKDPNGFTVLIAASGASEKIAKKLLAMPYIELNAVDKAGRTALMYSIMHDKLETIQAFIAHPKIDVNIIDENNATALIYAAGSSIEILEMLLNHPDIDTTHNHLAGKTVVHLALMKHEYRNAGYLISRGVPFSITFKDKLLILILIEHLGVQTTVRLLLADMPVCTSQGQLLKREDHQHSWTTFLDLSHRFDMNLRLQVVKEIINHEMFAMQRLELAKQLALTQDPNGRTAMQITDAATRDYLQSQIFFCGRYEVFDGPPIHVSSTAVVVNAYDHGVFKQVFDQFANEEKQLDLAAFVSCGRALLSCAIDSVVAQKQHSTIEADFRLWDKNNNQYLSETEYLRYCDQTYGGKLKVAMKFMRNADEYAREVDKRQGLDHSCVLQLLPTLPQDQFKANIDQLTFHDNASAAQYPHVLVMPAADRSLEDIYLKERPNDNQIRTMLQEIAIMLQHMHTNQVVHGDLKKLNVLRVNNHMKLIDLDATTAFGEPVGVKFSSGILSPEMFYQLKSDAETDVYNAYWSGHIAANPDLAKKIQPHKQWVIRSFAEIETVNKLPYPLVPANTALDMWAFGALMYQMYSGVELVPTDRNQDVDDSNIERAAAWTQQDLTSRIRNKVSNPLARDLIEKLLVVDPNDRMSVGAMLGHEYFDIKVDVGGKQMLQQIDKKLDSLATQVDAGLKDLTSKLDTVVELSRETVRKISSAKQDLLRGIFQATEVRVPTSFVLLPFNVLDKKDDEDDVEDVLQETASFLHKTIDMGAKFMKAVKANKYVGTAIKLVSPGEPLFLYLIDEVQGSPVVPPRDDVNEPLYPIRIETKSDEYTQFMTTAMPYLQTGFKMLQGANAVASLAKSLGVPSLDADVLDQVKTKIEQAKKTSSVFDFGVLQSAVESHDKSVPVQHIRGAALRELERFFDKYDADRDFSALARTYDDSGQALWTAKESIEAFESSRVGSTTGEVATNNAKPSPQEIYANLLRQGTIEKERKKMRTTKTVAVEISS